LYIPFKQKALPTENPSPDIISCCIYLSNKR
jgi:hypothetical protein